MKKLSIFKGKKDKSKPSSSSSNAGDSNNNDSTEERARPRPRGPRATRSMGGNSVASGASSNSSNGGGKQPGAEHASDNTTVFKVSVPEGVRPGQEFQVYAGTRIVRVKCPLNSTPGQTLSITVPRDPNAPMPSSDKHKGAANGPQLLKLGGDDQQNMQQQQQQQQQYENVPHRSCRLRLPCQIHYQPHFKIRIICYVMVSPQPTSKVSSPRHEHWHTLTSTG